MSKGTRPTNKVEDLGRQCSRCGQRKLTDTSHKRPNSKVHGKMVQLTINTLHACSEFFTLF